MAAGQSHTNKRPPSPNGAPTLTPLGHYAGRPDLILSRTVTVIGSRTGTRIHLASSTVSKAHAVIVNSQAGPYIHDLCSRAGVFVNNEKVREAELNDGDLIQIGKFKFQFNAGLPPVHVEPGRDAPAHLYDRPAPAAMFVEGAPVPMPFDDRALMVGRRDTSDIPLLEESVSTSHAVIFEFNGKRHVRDLGSRTGTFVNGRRVAEQQELKFGDELTIGETVMRYDAAPAPAEEDELEHLIGTAPLGDALDMLARGAAAEARQQPPQEQRPTPPLAPMAEVGPAASGAPIPVVRDDEEAEEEPSRPAPPAPAARAAGDEGPLELADLPPADAAEAPDAADDADRIELEGEAAPAVEGAGDTRTLPVEPPREPGKPRSVVLRPEAFAVPIEPAADEAAESEALEPEEDTLQQLRRGWRGLASDEDDPGAASEEVAAVPAEPAADAPQAEVAPVDVAQPETDESPAGESAESEAAPLSLAPEADVALTGEVLDETPEPSVDALALDVPTAAAEPPAVEPVAPEALSLEPAASRDEDVVAAADADQDEHRIDLSAPAGGMIEESPVDVLRDQPVDASLELQTPDMPADESALAAADDVTIPLEMPAADDAAADQPEPVAETPLAVPPTVEPAPEPEPVAEVPLSEPIAAAPPSEPVVEVVLPVPARGGRGAKAPKEKKPRAPRKGRGKKGAAPVEPEVLAEAASEVAEPPAPPTEADVEAAALPADAPAASEVRDATVERLEAEPEPVVGELSVSSADRETETDAGLQVAAVSPEVLESTEPTPESALDIDDEVARMLAEPAAPDATAAVDIASADGARAELTDTHFGRDVAEFVGESTGPLIEATATPEPDLELSPGLTELTPAPEPAARDIDAPVEPVAEAAPLDEASAEDVAAAALSDQDTTSRDTRVANADEPAELPAEFLADLDAPRIDPTPVAEVPALDLEALATPAEPVAPTPAVAPVARAPETQPQQPPPAREEKRTFPTPPPPARRQPPRAPLQPEVPGFGWGPNQEHFLGGQPLRLDRPSSGGVPPVRPRRGPAPFGRVPVTQRSGDDAGDDEVFSDPPSDDMGVRIPPFRGTEPRRSQVTTGFDGLAMPPVREVDVFSQFPGPDDAGGLDGDADDSSVGDDVFGGRRAPRDVAATAGESDEIWADEPTPPLEPDGGDAGAPPAPMLTQQQRRRGGGGGRAPVPPAPAAGNVPTAQPAKKKRRWFGLRALLILMVPSMIAAGAIVYAAVPARTAIEGQLRFTGFDTLRRPEQQDKLGEQKRLLMSESVREMARQTLFRLHPEVSSGFLSDSHDLQAVAVNAAWGEGPHGAGEGVLRLQLDETSLGVGELAALVRGRSVTPAAQHRARMHALLEALYLGNGTAAEDAVAAQRDVARLTAAAGETQAKLKQVEADIERHRASSGARPDPGELARLEGQSAALKKAWEEAVAAATAVEAHVKQLRAAMPADPQPAGTAAAPVVADPETAKLEAELALLNERIAAARARRTTTATDARAQLDEALAAFEKEVAAAQDAMKDNPELSAYIEAARRLQRRTRELTDQFMKRQQEQYAEVSEQKARLAESMEARRADAWEKDPELREMNDQLAIATRKYNAAVGGGYKAEAEELKAEIGLLEGSIKARQTLIGDDPVLADTIRHLEGVLVSMQRRLEDDRKSTDALLMEMQQAFTKSQPAVEKLPAEQKELARRLDERLASINEARRRYNAAADEAGASADEELRQMESGAAAVAAQLADRKNRLAAETAKTETARQEQARLAELTKREADLAAAQQAAATAQAKWSGAEDKLREARAAADAARQAGERTDELTRQREALMAELNQINESLVAKRHTLDTAVAPLPPTEADVRAVAAPDSRPLYSLIAVGAVAALFAVMIPFAARSSSTSGVELAGPMIESDPEAEAAFLAAAGGSRNGNHSDVPSSDFDRDDRKTSDDETPVTV